MDLRVVLFELSRMLENVDGVVSVSSAQLGTTLGVSQQTASRYLAGLEKNGLIKRVVKKRGQEVSLTKEGLAILKNMHDELGLFIQGKKRLEIAGKVSIGLGEGAYYIKMYADKIEKQLGFQPYYGTLNVKVDEMPAGMQRLLYKMIPPFEKEGRSFGGIKIVKVKLRYGKKTVECFLIMPERTHHKNELEIISKENLREKLGLKDGSNVTVEIH
jgi:riboflavin kinase